MCVRVEEQRERTLWWWRLGVTQRLEEMEEDLAVHMEATVGVEALSTSMKVVFALEE